jgi:hypothetical protein
LLSRNSQLTLRCESSLAHVELLVPKDCKTLKRPLPRNLAIDTFRVVDETLKMLQPERLNNVNPFQWLEVGRARFFLRTTCKKRQKDRKMKPVRSQPKADKLFQGWYLVPKPLLRNEMIYAIS